MFRFVSILILLSPLATSNEFADLTRNFFSNLEQQLEYDFPTIDASMAFTDKQVANFVALIQQRDKHSTTSSSRLTKRQIVDTTPEAYDFGVQMLEGIEAVAKLPVVQPKDLLVFQHHDANKTYAATLEANDQFKIFKYEKNNITLLHARKVNAGQRLALITHPPLGTFIVIAENTSKTIDFHNKTAVYLFEPTEVLRKMQNLHLDYASDVALWVEDHDVFMAITQQYTDSPQGLVCATQSTVFKWRGGHFDVVQQLNTTCATRVTPFTIGRMRFLAMANHAASDGGTDVYSEIFKYDLHTQRFVLHQKIATRGAADFKFFAFRHGTEQENYIAVANTYSKDDEGMVNYNVKSMVYKYVEGYFLPFQSFDLVGVTDWLPVTGKNSEFALLAACKHEGVKIFQYNGWKFVPSGFQYTQEAFAPGVLSMRSYVLNGSTLLFIANANEERNIHNVYRLEFKWQNQVDKHYKNLLGWCEGQVNALVNTKQKQARKRRRHADLQGLRQVEADMGTPTENTESNIAFIEVRLESQKEQLERLEEKLQTPAERIIDGNLTANRFIINNKVTFTELVGETLNNINIVGFLQGILPIDHLDNPEIPSEIQLERLDFETLTVDNLTVNTINGHRIEELITEDNIETILKSTKQLFINGSLTVNSLQVQGTLNNLNFTRSNILLLEGDQVFGADIFVESLHTENLDTNTINKLNLDAQIETTPEIIEVSSVDTLNVKQLTIAGYMNEIDLPTLDKYTLKTNGDQEITAQYIFEELQFGNLQTPLLNGFSIPQDLVKITEGIYTINQDVEIVNDLTANEIVIINSVNNILAKEDGNLDVLLKNTSELQSIKRRKTIHTVELLQPIKLQGKIISESLQGLNPVTKISEPLELLGDYVINGNITVESLLAAHEIADTNGLSVGNLEQHGLKLTTSEIPVKLEFTQQLNTPELFVDRINGHNVYEWVQLGTNETQYIKGWKTFVGDLSVMGAIDLRTVNDINVVDLNEDLLRTSGDQTITGRHTFNHITVDALQVQQVTMNSQKPLEAIMTNDVQQDIENAFIGMLSIDRLNVTNIQVDGFYNGINFTEMIEDTLFKRQYAKVTGAKTFTNLTVSSLISRRSLNMNRIPTLIRRAEAVTGTSTFIELPQDIVIDKIRFKNYLNDLSAGNFQQNWLDGSVKRIEGDQVFSKVTVYGNLLVDSNRINDLNLRRLVEDTVKADEDFEFDDVTFHDDLISLKKISLDGHIEDLDIDSIVADNGQDEIQIDSLIFKEGLVLNTPADITGSINGFNFNALCNYANPEINENPKSLIIEGNAIMMKTPIIKNLNSQNVQQLQTEVWFTDQSANLTNIRATTVNFLDEVTVDGFVAGTNLQSLRDNYFSKTSNQTITAAMNFEEGITIKGGLHSPSATLQGSLNDINLDEFVRTAILHGWDQTFEDILYVENLSIDQLEGNFKVNGLDLETDVMRYDGENFITGRLTLDNAEVGLLNVDRNFTVQGVDLKHWTQHAILTTGNQHVEGRIEFANFTVFTQGISLPGLLNNKLFSAKKVMLKSSTQIVTGRKIFVGDEPCSIEHMKLKGVINNLNLGALIENMAFKQTGAQFVSPLNFNATVTAQNINFNALVHGVNVSSLLSNLTTSSFIENYYEHFDELKKTSMMVQESLQGQANYLNHFRTLQTFAPLIDMLPMRTIDGTLHLAALRTHNNTYLLDFFEWSHRARAFVLDATMKEITLATIRNFFVLDYFFGSYLYIEKDYYDAEGNTRIGHVLSSRNMSDYEISVSLVHNGTRGVHALFLRDVQKTCVLLVHAHAYMDIYCQDDDGNGMELLQRLSIDDALDVRVAQHTERLEIIAVEKGDEDGYGGVYTTREYVRYPAIVVWIYDTRSGVFKEHQRIFTATPVGVSTAEFNDNQYLAIASGHLINSLYSGRIDIKKYDPITKTYVDWQVLPLSAPLQVELAVLPSNELYLYVLRNSPVEMLQIYQYRGIEKFVSTAAISTLQGCYAIAAVTDRITSEHFIITKCFNGEVDIIQGVFKS